MARRVRRTSGPLDLRTQAILRAVIEEYVTTATPVGSQALVERYGLGVSSATVRSVLAERLRPATAHPRREHRDGNGQAGLPPAGTGVSGDASSARNGQRGCGDGNTDDGADGATRADGWRDAGRLRSDAQLPTDWAGVEAAVAAAVTYALAYTGLADSYSLHIDYRNVPVHEGFEHD